MKKLNVVMCSWRSPDLLKVCVDSLLDSFTVDASVKVVLNDGDKDSVDYLMSKNIDFVKLGFNGGTLSVDYARDLLDGEYWCTYNDDFLSIKGWDKELISIVDEYYPATASCFLVEPRGIAGENPVVLIDDLGHITDPTTRIKFEENYKNGKYKMPKRKISYTHPWCMKTKDYFEIGCYSNNFDQRYFPGYGLDDNAPFRFFSKFNGECKFVTSKDFCVYHQISATNSRLPANIKSRSGWNEFIEDAGISLTQFKKWINCFSEID